MTKLREEALKEALKHVQELKQKLLVFKNQYELSSEAYSLLNSKTEEMRKKISKIHTLSQGGINPLSLQPIVKYIHDCKEWIPAFAEGYELADEAVNTLYKQYDQLAQKFEN